MPPHLLIHGRGQHQGGRGRQGQGGQQVIGHAGRQPRHQVGAGRGHQDQFRPARQFDVIHARLGGRVQEIQAHRIPRQGLKGQGRDKGLGGPRHHHPHLRAGRPQAAGQLGRLIGGDATANAQQHLSVSQGFHLTLNKAA